MAPRFSLADYIKGVEEGWPEEDVYRIVVSGLPRGFYALSFEGQRAALKERVPLTGTRWDALLAAVVEHVAWLARTRPTGVGGRAGTVPRQHVGAVGEPLGSGERVAVRAARLPPARSAAGPAGP